MLIKEISEDIAVIIINKVPVSLWKRHWKRDRINFWASCSHCKILTMEMLCWSSSSQCSPIGYGFAFPIFFFPLGSTICRLEFGLISLRLAEGSRKKNHTLTTIFQQPKALHVAGTEMSVLCSSYPGNNAGYETQWHFKDLWASHLASNRYRSATHSLYSYIMSTCCR